MIYSCLVGSNFLSGVLSKGNANTLLTNGFYLYSLTCDKLIKQVRNDSFEVLADLTVAYILAKVEAGKDQDVLSEVKKRLGVTGATPTYGVYDLHVEVSFDTMDDLDKFIFDEIRRIPGIKETVTLIAFKRDKNV